MEKIKLLLDFCDLTAESQIIKKFQLQKILTHTKFQDGYENFKSKNKGEYQ